MKKIDVWLDEVYSEGNIDHDHQPNTHAHKKTVYIPGWFPTH